MVSEEKKIDKEWWEDEILTPIDETFKFSSRSHELITQAFELLESDCPENLSKINECLDEIEKDDEQSKKILQEIKDKLNKKYPKREYDHREKSANIPKTTFEEYCNNDLYTGLEALQNNPNYRCSFKYNGKTYTGFSISIERNKIHMHDDQGNSCSMDLNELVNKVWDKTVKMNIIERSHNL